MSLVNTNESSWPLRAILLVTPTCTYCAAMKTHLNKLQSEGLIAGVDIIDVTQHPEIAQQYAVKSVPWLKLGPIHLFGAQSELIIRQWLNELSPAQPATQLFAHLLETNELDQVIGLIQSRPVLLSDLLPIISDPEQDLKIRLGVSAVIESLTDTEALKVITPQMEALSRHPHERVRADAAYYLGLVGGPSARSALERLAQDENPEVRDIALEGLNGNV